MEKALVSFICWNRAGLNARNLNALLKSTDDFELYIIDSNSSDDTWEFIKTLNDKRIKEIKKVRIYILLYLKIKTSLRLLKRSFRC